MKIGFFSESPADQAALAVFAEGILGRPPEPINVDLQAHGVTGVLRALDGVIRGLHYNSDAEGLVIVVDCDDTKLHELTHDTAGGRENACRFCQVRTIVERAPKQLKPIVSKERLRIAIGLTVPAIEAWYLVGKNHEVGEVPWIAGCSANKRPFTRPQLKQLVYGTDRPSIELETHCAVTEARRVLTNLNALESAFPIGFGLMANEIRSWKPQNT